MGPYPSIEEGVPSKEEWEKLEPGGIKMKEVLEYVEKLK